MEIQVLRRAGHSLAEAAKFADVSKRTVMRVGQEAAVVSLDDVAERARRDVGRPSKAEPFREFVVNVLQDEPAVMSGGARRRARPENLVKRSSAQSSSALRGHDPRLERSRRRDGHQ
jgi:hypothetical protein